MTIDIEALQLKLGHEVGNHEYGFDTVVAKSWCLVDGIGELVVVRLRSVESDGDKSYAADSIMAAEIDTPISVKADGQIPFINPDLEVLCNLDRKTLDFRSYSEV